MGILILNTISKFSKVKNETQKRPPKVGILILNTFSKFSKIKKNTQKRPPKVSKSKKTDIRSTQIKKFYKIYHFEPLLGEERGGRRPPKLKEKKLQQL